MAKAFVITGTPGTGKTRLAELLRKKLKGAVVIRANDVVEEGGLFTSYSEGSKLVRMRLLERALNRMVRDNKGKTVIIEGHLLCDMKVKGATAIVIREHLDTLRRRLAERKYPTEKIKANIVSEATDYCGLHADVNYKQVFELMGSDARLLSKAVAIIGGKKVKKEEIDLLRELIPIIKRNREFAI